MKKYLLSISLIVFLLAGCSATGPSFVQLESTLPVIDKGNGRVFFIRESSWMASAVDARVAIDGEVVGKCPNGAFFWEDLTSGQHLISVDHWGNFGQWDLSIEITDNALHYVLITPRKNMEKATYLLGVVGQAAEAAVAQESKSGTFQAELLDIQKGKASLNKAVFKRN